jgi:hypothetical protein
MKRTVLMAALTLCLPLPALSADRLSDRDVKALVSRIEEGRNRFDDKLDDKLKNSIVRRPEGEVNVKNFLNDFQENIDRLEERLKPEYAASAEVHTLLRQGTAINAFFRQQPAGTRGESEWNRLATDLKTLAAAYGTEFPLPEGAQVRRIGDHELAASVQEVERSAGKLKDSLNNELKKDKTIGQPQREAIVGEADQLAKDAKALRERVKDGDPSSAEAERLLTQAAKLNDVMSGRQLPVSAGNWGGVTSKLPAIANAYGAAWPGR